MLSPLPGMDPFVERSKWRDFHTMLCTVVRERLNPQLLPRYGTNVEERLVLHSEDGSRRSIDPDATIFENEPAVDPPVSGGVSVLDTPVRVSVEDFAKQHRVEIFSIDDGRIVTVIEVLSPTNKRVGGEDRADDLRKRRQLLRSEASLVEIDLVRQGRPFNVGGRAETYNVFVSRPWERPYGDLYPVRLFQRLPRSAVPLDEGVEAATLDLQEAVDTVYDRAGYAYMLKYADAGFGEMLDPPLPEKAVSFVRERLRDGATN